MFEFQRSTLADFRKSVMAFVAVCLSLLPVMASEVSESAELRTSHDAYASVKLGGDVSDTSLSVNWEIDLANVDGNQNHFSMAKCGNNLYVCIDYFDSPRAGKLFLREYRISDGNNRTLEVELPDDLKSVGTRFHTIVTDEDDNLLAVFLRRNQENVRHPELVLCKIELLQNEIALDIDNAVVIQLHKMTLAPLDNEGADIYSPWVGTVQHFTGSFDARLFQFEMAFGWNEDGTTNKYAYLHIQYEEGDNRSANIDVLSLGIEDDLYVSAAPDVVAFPADDELLMVTRAPKRQSDGSFIYFTSKLYRGGVLWNAEVMGENDVVNCRGFHTFMHNGHELSVYAAHHNEKDGSAFNIVEWNKEHDAFEKLWEAPGTAFKCDFSVSPVYPVYYRQLAITEDGGSPLARNGGVSTNLYLCSPGSGIGSYTITTPDISTGIESFDDGSRSVFVKRGNKIYVRCDGLMADGELRIFDLSGRVAGVVGLGVQTEDGIELSSLVSPGVYLVKVDADVLKVVID